MSQDAETPVRDTDMDWREIGDSQPFWGVLTHPQFRRENLNAESLAAFYASGAEHMAELAGIFEQLTGEAFHASAALDFGCGTGRLAEAMKGYADAVTGYDISPGMLEAARKHGAGKVDYTGDMPGGMFDWVNSYIVFQHIPPARGLELLATLLGRLAPRGYVSLHFTIYRNAEHRGVAPPGVRVSRVRRVARWLRRQAPRLMPQPPAGTMMMYDYDLNRLCEMLNRAGIDRMLLVHEDHGGHHGVKIFGRKED
jgi:SAM-dependent methyltransferase